MNNMQQLIIDTYAAKPKHFTQILKRNAEVINYIKFNVPDDITDFLEQLYFIVYGDKRFCDKGNRKQLKSFAGYSFCGKTGICECAKISVSESVIASKLQITAERKNEISEKRKSTNLIKYGVENTGLLEKSKIAHSELYKDKDRVEGISEQIRETKKQRYGDEKYNNHIKTEQTNLERYNVKNTWSLRDDKQNPSLNILRDVESLKNIFPRYSVDEISSLYNLHPQTIYWYLNKHGMRQPYKSTFEQEIIYFLNSLGITNIITNKRTIIGKELDIFLPDYNLAIEYNGVYWHHDKISHITKEYHREKFLACEEKGIELFTIFSDSWDEHKEIWKNKI